jgi:hypothetical protein
MVWQMGSVALTGPQQSRKRIATPRALLRDLRAREALLEKYE